MSANKPSVKKFRKKPVVIEAVRWTGNNGEEVKAFAPQVHLPGGGLEALMVHTLEGKMRAEVGDWIIKGVHGEFYPCKPDIFWKSYEAVDSE